MTLDPPASPDVTLVLVGAPDDRFGPDRIAATVASLQAQAGMSWELVIPGGAPGDCPADEPRVRAVSGDDAFRRAVDDGRGTWVGLIGAGDTLDPSALEFVSEDLSRAPGAVAVYTDEDHPGTPDMIGDDTTPDEVRVRRYKPDWSPERLRHGDVLGRLCLLRADVVRAVGGWNPDAGPAGAYDLALRVTETGGPVVHVPEILYHAAAVPQVPDGFDDAVRSAAERQLRRLGLPATVEPGPVPGAHRIRRTLDPAVRISLVIPTGWHEAVVRGESRCLVLNAVRTMLSHTDHEAVQVVVVYDDPVPPGALDALREIAGDRLLAVPYRKPFNFSEKCNVGFLHATGDVIVLANDDLEPVSANWLESLVAPALEADVGLVGTKLIYEDGSIQHGGHLHVRHPYSCRPNLAYRKAPADTVGDFHSLVVNRETSGVTGACVALRREVYEQVGGLTEELPASYNDVDLSLKVTAAGLRILWLAEPVCYHFESKSREPVVAEFEQLFMFRRWGGFPGDAYLPWLMPPVPRPRPVRSPG